MNKVEKFLSSLTKKEKLRIKEVLLKIKFQNFNNLDIKKLKGRRNFFRARKGKLRIIFLSKKDKIFILSIERRNENTYKRIK